MTCDCLCTPWAAWLRAEYRDRGHPRRKKVAGGSPQIPKAMLCLPNIKMVARVASVFVSRHHPNFPSKTFGFREAKLATPYLPPENNHLLLRPPPPRPPPPPLPPPRPPQNCTKMIHMYPQIEHFNLILASLCRDVVARNTKRIRRLTGIRSQVEGLPLFGFFFIYMYTYVCMDIHIIYTKVICTYMYYYC